MHSPLPRPTHFPPRALKAAIAVLLAVLEGLTPRPMCSKPDREADLPFWSAETAQATCIQAYAFAARLSARIRGDCGSCRPRGLTSQL